MNPQIPIERKIDLETSLEEANQTVLVLAKSCIHRMLQYIKSQRLMGKKSPDVETNLNTKAQFMDELTILPPVQWIFKVPIDESLACLISQQPMLNTIASMHLVCGCHTTYS